MRHFVLRSRVLAAGPYGSHRTSDQLGMTDDKLDEFVAAGYAVEVVVDEAKLASRPQLPAGNATRTEWVTYAVSQGVDPGDMSRDELRERFAPAEPFTVVDDDGVGVVQPD